ncbi:hypothetical protein ACFLU1_02915 [Chloroflexota bacterium]
MKNSSSKQENSSRWETIYHIGCPPPFEDGDPDTISLKHSIYPIASSISIQKSRNDVFQVYIEYLDDKKQLVYSGKERGRIALEAWDRVVESFIGGPSSTWLWRGLTDKRKEYIRDMSASSWVKIRQVLDLDSDCNNCLVQRNGRRIGNLTKRLDMANWVLFNSHNKYGYPEGFMDKNY